MYNPATVETVSGEVVSVETMMPMKGMGSEIHLTLKTEKETIPVHLGPSWFLDRLDSKIEKGDRIRVKGSRVTMAGKTTIIAAEVKKGDNLLLLRDTNGVPVWSGWRR
jgi:DNA helicase TIP49 (TBP-interacting protein)